MVQFLLISAGVILLIWLYFKFFKIPKIKNLMFVDGGLGAGKSFYCVHLAVRLYKRNMRRYKIAKVIFKPFALMKKPPKKSRLLKRIRSLYWNLEEPILYSNIPLRNVKHSKLTLDIILRKVRVARKSVILMDDVSVIVDQMNFKDRILNKQLSLFFKLWRHESHGGYIIANSQSVADIHHAFKYALSDYLYLHSSFRVPFFRVIRSQEMHYTADKDSGSIAMGTGKDIEETLKMVLVRSKYFKYYDSYCYSILTDGLEIYDKSQFIKYFENAKTGDVLTLDVLTRQLLYGGEKNEQTFSS